MGNSPIKTNCGSPENSPTAKIEDTEEDPPKDTLHLKKLKPVKKPELVTYRNKANGERQTYIKRSRNLLWVCGVAER